jgi:hypothetical protein
MLKGEPMKKLYLAAGLCAVSLAAAASAEKPTGRELRQTSWGKPGVSLEEYRIDAGICAWRATNLDISGTKAARTMVKASQALDHMTYVGVVTFTDGVARAVGSAINMRNVEDRFRVDEQFDAIADVQYDALYQCLNDRGYRRFQLTEDQVRRLRKLRAGSLKRHIFLHQLGSNPAVLAQQAL